MIFNGRASNAAARRLLTKHHLPHFVNEPTKPLVLSLYRQTLRESQKFMDPLCREYLRAYIYESFCSFKYIGDGKQIHALTDISKDYLYTLRRSNTKACLTSIASVMHLVFTSYKTTELPLKSLFKNTKRVDHNHIAFRLKHLHPPPNVASFEEHFEATKSQQHLFYKLMAMLKKNKTIFGARGRKLYLDLPIEGTITGEPLPLSRQKNSVAKFYKKILKDLIRPVHPDIIEYLVQQIEKPHDIRNITAERFYKRRLEHCLKTYYTVTEEKENGELSMHLFNNRRRNLSPDIYAADSLTSSKSKNK